MFKTGGRQFSFDGIRAEMTPGKDWDAFICVKTGDTFTCVKNGDTFMCVKNENTFICVAVQVNI